MGSRRSAAALCAACCAAALAVVGGAAGSTSAQTALEAATLAQINVVRAQHGLVPLAFSPALLASASAHDRQMVTGGYFGHEDPDGTGFASRIEHFYAQGRFLYYAIGENLYWTQGPVSGPALVARWMQSPEHRANLLNPNWRQVGVAVLNVTTAPGVFNDVPVTVVTVDFGVRH
jgi:uncharacterized protein YkwD